jgi:ABC-type multidrug transport system fused ATPase/permease subunit
VLIILSVILGFISILFIFADTSISKANKYIITTILIGIIVTNFFILPFISKTSVSLYIYYYESELMEIKNILINKNSSIKISNEIVEDKENTLNDFEKVKLLEVAEKIKSNWIFLDSSRVGYFINKSYVIVYSEKPVIGCFYNESSKEYSFKTQKINNNWYIFYPPYWL